jgi:hypothetical protein
MRVVYGMEDSMTIREKVARAICKADTILDCAAWERRSSEGREDFFKFSDAAITAFLEAAAAEGWHMRPNEATAEMNFAGEIVEGGSQINSDDVYEAMFAAAPEFEWDK